MTDYSLGIRITGDGRVAVQAFDQTAAAGKNMGSQLGQAASSATSALNSTERAAGSLDSSLNQSISTITRWGAALYGLHELREFAGDVVESTNKLSGWQFGLQAATGSQQAAADSLSFVRSESDRLGLSLEDSAGTFTRLTAATKGTALQGVQTRQIFTSVAEAARALHLSGAETNQTLLALDQMMSKGTVQAQELKLQLGNVIPGAVHVMADALGVTTSKLEKMMDAGQVLAEDALPKLAKRLDEIYGAAAGDAAKGPAAELQRFKNSVFELEAAIGNAGFMSVLAGGAADLTSALTSLTQSGTLDHVVTGLEAVAAVGTANFLAGYVSQFQGYISAVAEGVVAQREAAATTQAAAAVQVEATSRTVADTAAEEARTAVRLASIDALIASNQATLAAANAEVVASTEALGAMRAQAAVATAVVEANAARAASWEAASTSLAAAMAADSRAVAQADAVLTQFTATQIRALEAMQVRDAAMAADLQLARQQVLVETELAATRTATAAATQAAAAAQTELATASATTSLAMQGLSKVGTTVLGLLGGWPGVILLAGAALVYLATRQTDAEKSADELATTTERLAAAHGQVTEAAIKSAAAQLDEKQAVLAVAQAHLASIEAQRGYVTGVQNMEMIAVRSAQASEGVKALTGSIKQLSDQIQKSNVDKAWQDNLDFLSAGAAQDGAAFDQLTDKVKKQTATLKEQVATFGKGKAAQAEYAQGIAIAAEQAKGDNSVTQQRVASIKALFAPQIEAGKQLDALTASKKANTAATRDAKKDEAEELRHVKDISAAYASLANTVDTLSGKNTDPVSKAWADSAKSIRDIAEQGGILIKNGEDETVVQQQVSQAIDVATAARERAVTAARKQMDVAGQIISDMQQEARMAGLSAKDQAVARAGIAAETKLRQDNLGLTADQIAAQKSQVEAAAAGLYDVQQAASQQAQIAQEFAGYWENADSSVSRAFGDLITRRISGWKDFGKQLKSITQQFVSDMIAQFVRLNILGPIAGSVMQSVGGYLGLNTNSLAGTGLSLAANYFGGGATASASPVASALMSNGSTSTDYLSLISNGRTAYNAYGWIQNGGIGNTLLGTGSTVEGSLASGYTTSASLAQGNLASYGVNPTAYAGVGNVASAPSYTPGMGVYAAGALGALYGVTQAGNGTGSKIAAGASYGALGVGASGAIGGALAGTGAVSGATAAFTSTGAALGASMSWVPVAGWILAAMAVIDTVSGGKLFGTSYQATAANSTLSLGQDGASASSTITEKKQKALFGGAQYRTKDVAVTPEMQEAADKLYNSVKKSMVQGAQQLGTTVPPMIDAQLQIATDINSKSGKTKSTSYLVNYLGRTWEEATADLATQRIGAEAIVATVAQSAGAAAQQLAEQWRDSADTLLDGAQAMLAAQTDITKGNTILAAGANATLQQVIGVAQSMQQDGETLAAAYTRLQQANQSYLSFIQQFQDTVAGSDFAYSLKAINDGMQDNIDQANALAIAAGLQGAREQDLANIHTSAAQQAAAAIQQLGVSAATIAQQLYGVTTDTVAGLGTQIDALKSKLSDAASTALGDNSIYTDSEKLDLALQGLAAGVVSQEDVLSIGKQLYGSSSGDYRALFGQVSQLAGAPSTSADFASGLDSLADLQGRQGALQAQADAAARVTNAKTLAQYISDLSSVEGTDYNAVATRVGVPLDELAKDLGVSDITSYLDDLQQQDVPGAVTDAKDAIVEAIRGIGADVMRQIYDGPVAGASTPAPAAADPVAPVAPVDQTQSLLAQMLTELRASNAAANAARVAALVN